jgi:hypothetical protein
MKFNLLFWIILACGLLSGVIFGVRWQADAAQDIQPEFRSLAKVIVTWELPEEDSTAPYKADLYGTCIEILESPEMKRRALERVRALHRDLRDLNVEIRTARTPGSGIINILATGAEAKYTRVFLDALIDEFIAFRTNVREQEHGRVLQSYLQEVVTLQKVMEETISRHNRARAASPPTEGPAEIERLIARLTKLRDQRDDLRTAIRQEIATEPSPHAEQELKEVEQDISSHESQIKHLSTALQELRQFEESRTKATTHYDTTFAEVEALQKQYTLEIDPVAIHARATPASMNIRSHSAPIIAGGFMGGALGGVIGFIAAVIASWRPTKITPLEP